MKKIFFATHMLLFGMINAQINQTQKIVSPIKNQTFYKASIEAPEDLEISSLLGGIYYNGEKIAVNNGTFMLKEDPNANIFNIIFTEAACAEFEESYTPTTRIAHIKTKDNSASRYFHLSRKHSCDKHENQEWKISEVTINKNSFKIPLDRTIIILMNPSHLATEPKEVFKNIKIGSSKTIISLPTIILHHLLDKKEEQSKMLIAQLSSIDLNTLHTKTESKKISEQRGPTVIVYNQN